MHYYRINLHWIVDLEPAEMLFYAVCLDSYKNCTKKNKRELKYIRIDEKTGEVYRMLPNNYFKAMYGTISSGRIKSYLDRLEEEGYISILGVRRPNKQLRYVQCKKLNDEGDSIYIPGDYLDQSVYLLFGIGLYIKTLIRGNNTYFEEYMDYFEPEEWERIIREMVREKMFTEDGDYEATDFLTDIAKDFFDYWQSHKKDC